jgi:hypothetical protein
MTAPPSNRYDDADLVSAPDKAFFRAWQDDDPLAQALGAAVPLSPQHVEHHRARDARQRGARRAGVNAGSAM